MGVEPNNATTLGRFIPVLGGACGVIIAVLAVRAAWATAPGIGPLDRDLFGLVAACLAPGGVALGLLAALVASIRPAQWSAGAWLLLPAALVGLCWDLVWLDNGVHTGSLGKLAGGCGALLGSPLVFAAGLGAWAVGLIWPRQRDLFHWLGIGLSLALGAAWGWFLAVLLPLSFGA
ncbi:MAG: hypothetical protein K1X74_19755 [Pirellulales bacterium]|nr:hypothetical protein [Pirellulales bacterium]